jgi:hypothetical protein
VRTGLLAAALLGLAGCSGPSTVAGPDGLRLVVLRDVDPASVVTTAVLLDKAGKPVTAPTLTVQGGWLGTANPITTLETGATGMVGTSAALKTLSE